jgi:hypothetical protein
MLSKCYSLVGQCYKTFFFVTDNGTIKANVFSLLGLFNSLMFVSMARAYQQSAFQLLSSGEGSGPYQQTSD